MRRWWCLFLLVVLVGVGGCTRSERPPNVVLILADTLRADSLETYGYERPTSPKIAAFADDAVVFENAISVGASTPPTLSAIMTGRLPYYEDSSLWSPKTAHGMRRFYRDGEQKGLPFSLETLAERFQKSGFETIGIVNNAYVKKVYHFEQGFDEFVELFNRGKPKYGLAEQITQRATAFLRQPHEKPFFLYAHFMDPHVPYLPPEPWRSEFERDAGATMRDRYDASIRYMDHWIGVLLDELSRDELENTIVAFVSDHGEEFYDHGGQGHAGTLFEELVHIPFLIRGPGIRAGRETALVRNFDVGPTLLELAGAEPLEGDVDAVSLAGLLRGERDTARPAVLASFPVIPSAAVHAFRPPRRMLRDERYKLIFDETDPGRSVLFDLERDPGEKRNIYAEAPDVAVAMRDKLNAVVAKLEAENAAADERPSGVQLTGPDLAGLETERGSRIRSTAWGAKLVSRKKPPTVNLPYVPVASGRVFARVELKSPAPAARAFYRTSRDPKIRDGRSVPASTSRDGTRLEFVVEDDEIVGPLAIRFGNVPGEVRLLAVTVARTASDLDRPAEAGGGKAGEVDNETIEQLRGLGYVE